MLSRRGKWGFLAVVVLACAMVFAFAGSAVAAERNPECLNCHSSMGQDWSVAPVDRDTACVKCHTYGLAGTHPYHNAGGNCGAVCHKSKGWGESLQFAVPSVSTARGSFATAASSDTTAGVLHIIHSKPRWPAGVSTSVSQCGSCHQAAACDACHGDSGAQVGVNHQVHSATGDAFMPAVPAQYNPQAPWSGTVAYGIIGEDQLLNTQMTDSNQCATAGCHDLAGSASRTPLTKEDFSHVAYPAYGYPEANTVATTGTWSKASGSAYTGGSTAYSNYANSTFTFNFTGNYFELLTDVDPFRGQAEVSIDGTPVGTIDCYSPVTKQQQIVFRSDTLSTGAHQVRIRVLGTKQAAAQGTWVFVDALRAYTNARVNVAPKCDSCHPDRVAAHGTSFAHEASLTAGTYGGFNCTDCHDLAMITEHKRTTAKTSTGGSVCEKCHTTYAPYTLNAYNYTCYGTGATIDGAPQACHVGAATRHNGVDTTHTPTASAPEAKCRGCHQGNLDIIHSDSVTTNAVVTDCLDCHGVTKAPATKDCTGGCHDATGVDSMESHPYVTAAHQGSGLDAGVPNTGGLACSTAGCHSLELRPEHVNKSASTIGGAAFTCSGCHDQTYLPRPWNDQCVQCHVAGKAPAPHNAFAAKHDYAAYDVVNQTNCGGANCHNTALADVIHNTNAADGVVSGCAACHNAAETAATGVPTKKLCTNCHSNHNLATPHQSGAYPAATECLRCHDGFADINTAHPSCGTCHSSPVLTDYLQFNYTAACTDCHTAGVLGGTYTPADPQHYLGTETTHTASAQTGTESTFACTQCHYTEMKPEHIGKTTSAFSAVPATYPDKCVACHEIRVDGFPGAWNKTCDQCHATKHTAKATAHNATNQVLSGVLSTVTVETEDFGTSTTWPADWTRSSATTVTAAAGSGAPSGGSYGQISWQAARADFTFYKALDLSSYEGSAAVSWWSAVNVSNTSDYLIVEYSTAGVGGPYTQLSRRDTDQLTWTKSSVYMVPTGGTVHLRFRGSFNASGEYARVDDVLVEARQRGASPGNGSLCGGAGCHAVTDVSVIHNNSVTGNATVTTCANTCHTGPNSTASLKKDCNAAGCHNGGHNPAAHTANSPECVGCHETDNIQAVHPTCDTCHNNPSYPGITTTNTANCEDCHNAAEVYAKTYAPSEPNHYIGTETTHTSSGNGTYNTYACSVCHKIELKPEHAKASSSFPSTTTVIGKCTACHETKVDSFITAWDKKCASCHPTTHTDRSTKHNASVVGATCGGAGCHAITDVAVIHNNSITTNSMTPSCLTCHNSSDDVPTSITCEDAGCHQGMQHGHALNLAGSNYNNTTVTGCTNSGSGCHGSQAASPTPDYAGTYHPSSGCQTGPCHQANSTQADPAFNNPQTCQNCHGGRSVAPLNYDKAPDVISLVASVTAPTGGHYAETTHTAAGMLSTAKAKADGLTTATCNSCHNSIATNGMGALYAQHQSLQVYGNTTCYDCHNFSVGVAAEVVGNWTTDACIDCHNATDMGAAYSQHSTSSVPAVLGIVSQTATASPGTCDQGGGCHANLDLHELHKGDGPSGSGRPDPQCNVCHDPLKQGWKPTAKTCGDTGACHITQPHLNIGPAHSVTALSEACIECHETTDLRINHGYSSTCSEGTNTCHNNPAWPTLPTGKQECVDCHNATLVGAKNYAPHDNNHYVGTETTHTALNQTGTYGAITSVVATEGFNSATWPASWTRSNTTQVITANAAPLDEGTYYAQIYTTNTTRVSPYFQKVFDTSAVASPTLTFDYTTTNLVAPDYARVEYSIDGTNFVQLWNTTANQATWIKVGPLALPRSQTLTVRFSASVNANNSDRFRVDGIVVKGADGPGHACNACHQMELRPEHFKASSDATRVPSIYPDKCVDCHENRTDAITGVPVVAHWDKTCDQCHGAAASHLHQTTLHDATAIAPTCGGSGCHYTKDVAVIHNNSSATNPTVTNCTNTCHTSNTTLPTTLDCGAAGCHQGVQPHTHDLDRDGSLFNATTVTGCVDSGAGCHGNSASTDYTSYHPSSGCLTGPCHTAANHNDPQFNNPNTCMNCHGGGALLYNGATDRIPVVGATPDGHYPETTHTAAAAARTASMTAGGTITARCNQCHNDSPATGIKGLYPQHQSLGGGLGNTTCPECHNYNAGVIAEITGNWTTDTCADCHNVTDMPTMSQHSTGTAPVVTGTESQGAGSCVTTGCHLTTDLHALHKGSAATPPARAALGCAFSGCHDYTKQGIKPTAKSCGTGGACHTTDSHNPAAHNVVDTGTVDNCYQRCHEGVGNSAVTDIRNVYKSVGFGNVLAHDGCASCHNAGANLGASNTAECVDCHNATENPSTSGMHLFSPYDPNHYYTASHDSSLTTGANYGTTGQGKTLTDFHGTNLNFERACTTCHTIDLKTEHNKTSVAFNLGGKADKCEACHENKVDNWTGRWTGSCYGEANSCHASASLHGDWSTKHNASAQVMSAPGSSFTLGSTANVETENFGTTTTWPTDWTRSNTTYVTNQTGSARSGAAGQIGVNTTRTEYNFYKSINLTAYAGGTLNFWYQVNVGDTADFLVAEYSTAGTGGPYTEVFRRNSDALTWTQAPSISIPGGANVVVRFRGTFNTSGEYGRVDDITVDGQSPASFGAALPAGSTAAASCQNNPNGTECHNVADVANIHSRTPNSGCPICHTGTAQHATLTNCQAAGCHVGINVDNHNTAWHESTISNTAQMGASFATDWCRGCHDDSIDNEHFVLGAYGSSPCSMCHKKSSDSGAPTGVTSAVTSSTIHGDATAGNELCTDCHSTVSQTRPHVQRMGWTGLPNTGSSGIGNLQFQTTWSGHRSFDAMPGQKTSFTNAVDGVSANRTWTLPATANYLSNWSAATESSTMMVVCSDCHGSVTGATGPHGGSMTVNIASGYTNNYSTGGTYINGTAIGGNGICAKCHQVTNLFNGTANGNVHNRSNHKGTTGGRCINCHVKIPHAWKRPRLIGYTSDPAPYASLIVTGISDRAYTPTGWQDTYCGVGGSCGSHPANVTAPVWP